MKIKKILVGYLYILPVVLLLTILMAYPTFWTLWMSFQSKGVGGQAIFVGIQNFKELILSGTFCSSMFKTISYTLEACILKLFVGLGTGLALNKPFRGRDFLRSWLFIPWILPEFVIGLLFLWLLRMSGGINLMLGKIGVNPIYWLGPNLALTSVMLANFWHGFPFFMMGILAGLQSIPKELYEAAAMDGATDLQQFRFITLPGLRDVTLILFTLSSLWTFSQFAIAFTMTGGGPGNATEILPLLTYKIGFQQYAIGRGCAVAILSLPLFLALIIILVKLVSKETLV